MTLNRQGNMPLRNDFHFFMFKGYKPQWVACKVNETRRGSCKHWVFIFLWCTGRVKMTKVVNRPVYTICRYVLSDCLEVFWALLCMSLYLLQCLLFPVFLALQWASCFCLISRRSIVSTHGCVWRLLDILVGT